MQQHHIKTQLIRFRRWSRKSYAMFCSIGKYVTIGNLSKGIIEASLPKQKSINYPSIQNIHKEKNSLEEDPLESLFNWIDPFSLLIPYMVAVSNSTQDDHCKLNQIITDKQKPDEYRTLYPSGFFFSLKNTDYAT